MPPRRGGLALVASLAALLLAPAASGAAPLLGPPTNYAPRTGVGSITTGHLDPGASDDLAVSNETSSTATVVRNTGTGAFGTPVAYREGGGHPTGIAAGDLNGDGRHDLVLANHHKSALAVLLAQPGGGFGDPKLFPGGRYPFDLAIGDLDRDGDNDVAVANDGEFNNTVHRVTVLLGDGHGNLGPATYYETAGRTYGVAIADLNGDGKPDLVTADAPDAFDDEEGGLARVSLFFGRGDGTFGVRKSFKTGSISRPGSVAAQDLNGDGQPDVAVGGSGAGVLLNAGHRELAPITVYPGAAGSVLLRDLDGDGRRDLVTSGLSVLPGRGDGTFGPRADFAGGGGSLAIADYDGDGRPDVATNHASGISVVRNTGGAIITDVDPASGPSAGGTHVTITGGRFTGAAQVRFGDTPAASFAVVDDHRITAVAPPGAAGPTNIRVLAPYGISEKVAADRFTYVAPPVRGRPRP